MPNKKILPSLLISTLFLSIACSLIGDVPLTPKASSAVYAAAITAGGSHACALLNDGRVKCWGSNTSGELGDGTYKSSHVPVEVLGLTDAIAVSAGGSHTCALLKGGTVKCWGANLTGQLGDGTKAMRGEPVSVSGLTDAIAISAGSDHTCAINKAGGAKCWGKNLFGTVGEGTITRTILTPVDVVGLSSGVTTIAAGYEHTCAVTNKGGVKCWGKNDYGRIGNGKERGILKSPADVITLDQGVTNVATGFGTSCAVMENKSILCWGLICLDDQSVSPRAVAGLTGKMTAVAVGASHICGLNSSGNVKCLGENEYGQLGNGKTTPGYSAVKVKGLGNITAISANSDYTCALASDGRVFCWGLNTSWQLGNDTDPYSLQPVEVSGLLE